MTWLGLGLGSGSHGSGSGERAAQVDLAVGAAGEEGVAVDVQAAHDALVPDEHVRLLHRVEVPHADLAVLAAAVDGVVRHGEAVDLRARVEGEDELHQLEVPHLDRHVLGGGGEDVLVRDERADPRRVRLEGGGVGVRVEVPHLG